MERRPVTQPPRFVQPLVALFTALMILAALPVPTRAQSSSTTLPDFPVPGGHFYTQASGHGQDFGFSITDEGGIRFYSEFERLGGVDRLGYPASSRFTFGGFITQATQRALLQWRPDGNRVSLVNVFDIFTQRGLDPTLERTRLIPPTEDNTPDAVLDPARVVARHLALLDLSPPIKARYFADPDPITDFGLPQGAADFGAVYVVRCQRAAFQFWRVRTPFARPGDITLVNAGDLAKEFGLVPLAAMQPSPAAEQVIAPLGRVFPSDPATVDQARQSARLARASLVRIDVILPDGIGIASGIIMDASGHILTNAHVIANALVIRVTLPSGRESGAIVVAVDPADDIAVIQIPPPSDVALTPASFASGRDLPIGQTVAAIGYSPFFPSPPTTRIGVLQGALPSVPAILRSDLYILPGDSGGMLLDLSGRVIGINDEIRFTNQASQPLISFSIDAGDALRIARRLMQEG
jgi:S1-C subfamily serine protease